MNARDLLQESGLTIEGEFTSVPPTKSAAPKGIVPSGSGGGGGKGGGGGSSHVPSEAPNTLRSRQLARIKEIICEGPIEGWAGTDSDPLKSIYLNDVIIQNSDDSFNFESVTVDYRLGTPDQTHIQGFSDNESETVVNVLVAHATPVTRSIAARTTSNADSVRVTLGFPQLSYQDPSSGDLGGNSVSIQIEIQHNGGGYTTVKTDTIKGKCTARYQRAYYIVLDPTQTGPWDIRVTRVTADAVHAYDQNTVYWDAITTVNETALSHPDVVVVATEVDSVQFNSVPTRGFHIKGLKVKIPSNYDPITRAYTGVWDGTFIVAWTDNPAWCFYDLVTTKRYGLGQYVTPSLTDKWTLYTIGQYCDELVPDGFGGTEPRFTCNLYLQTREEAYKVLLNMASIFRGILFWNAGSLTSAQDSPSDPVMSFTKANISGEFVYSESSASTRHTVVLVSWNDPSDMYRQKIEYVDDADLITSYGIKESEIVAFGCSSRGQARRAGKWLLYTDYNEGETVAFRAALDALFFVTPGCIIENADPKRSTRRNGGRIVTATSTSVTLDAPTYVSASTNTLVVIGEDGIPVRRTVTNSAGTHTILTFTTPLTSIPIDWSIWLLSAPEHLTETWRVISISEAEDSIYADVVAVKHDPTKFDQIENNLILEAQPSRYFDVKPAPVENVNVVQSLVLNGSGSSTVKIHISWEIPRYSKYVEVTWYYENDIPVTVTVTQNSFDFVAAKSGVYHYAIKNYNTLGPALPVTGTVTVSGASVAPNVQGLSAYIVWTTLDVRITWTSIPTAGSYIVKTYTTGGTLLATNIVTTNEFTYTYERNVADGSRRSLKFGVVAVCGLWFSAAEQFITLTNAQHAAPTGITITPGIGNLSVSMNPSTEPDYKGTIIWLGTSTGFATDNAHKVYEGYDPAAIITGLDTFTQYFIKVAHYDSFDKSSLNYSSEYNSTTTDSGGLFVTATTPGTTYLGYDSVMCSSDGSIYVWTLGTPDQYIRAQPLVAASKVVTANLAAISANLGAVTAGSFTLDATGFIKGGATSYSSGTGFWFGYDSTTYKFRIGNLSGSYLSWDGSNIAISGGGHFTGSITVGTKFAVDSSGNITIKSASSGARMEIYNNVLKVYDSSGTLRVKLGDLS